MDNLAQIVEKELKNFKKIDTNCDDENIDNGGKFPRSFGYELKEISENLTKMTDQQCEEISLAWRNFRFEVNGSSVFSWLKRSNQNTKKVILNRLNGHLNYNTLNGFLGPSGAGKTTLLNCLNGTLTSSLTNDSKIYLNKREPNDLPVIRFVEQHVHETIIAKMTVRQVLYYAFRFKNGLHLSTGKKAIMDKHIRGVLHQLLLDESILDTTFELCSGGEQRRVAVAQELMSLKKPRFLFVDEPTTGLDSNAALLMIKCLRRLIDYPSQQQINDDRKITILVSIHSPNTDIMKLFDKVFILAKGGVCIYADSPKYLQMKLKQIQPKNVESQSLETKKPPIEEFMEIACNGINDSTVRQLADQTLKNEQEKFGQLKDDLKFLPFGIQQRRKQFKLVHFLLQIYRMFHIIFIIEYRILLLQFFAFLVMFVAVGTFFDDKIIQANACYSFDGDEENGLGIMGNHSCRDRMNAENKVDEYIKFQMYIMIISGITLINLSTILFMPILRVFYNEHRNRWYSMGTFYWPFILIRLLEITLLSIFISLLMYFVLDHTFIDDGHINWNRIGYFIYFAWLHLIFLQSYGHMISLLFLKRMEVAMVTSMLTCCTFHFFTGYMLDIKKLNDPLLIMIEQLVTLKTTSNGLLYAIFGLERCDQEGQLSFALMDFGVEQETVFTDTIYIAIHIVMIRFLTILLMFIRFSWNMSRKRFTLQPDSDMPILYFKPMNESKMNDDNWDSLIKRTKTPEENHYEKFSRNKILVAWRNVTLFASNSIYEIRPSKNLFTQGSTSKNNPKLILRNISGQFRFGTLNALMGPSGAGKTSLLKVLNGRMKTRLADESRFYLSRYTPIRGCYITQNVAGHLHPGLTGKQSLIYASKLKNDPNEKIDHEKMADIILEELNITDTAETYVQNCSGGEQKRLALAIELMSKQMPNLICIDEPTSGLDSNSSLVVIRCLRKVSHFHNITIITSIHQPNTEVMMMFDQVYVLAKGGVCVYSDHPTKIPEHLRQVEYMEKSEKDFFPLEELIKCSCLTYKDPLVNRLVESTNQDIIQHNNEVEIQTIEVMDGIPKNRCRFTMNSVSTLIGRYISYCRGYLWTYWAIFFSIYIFYALDMMYIFSPKIALRDGCFDQDEDFNNTCNQTEDKELEKFELSTSFMYNFVYSAMYCLIVILQSSVMFSKEIVYFYNEHRNGWYSTGAFYLMKIIVEMVPMIPLVFIYTFIIDIYETVRPGTYYWLVLIILLGTMVSQALGQLLATFSNGNNSAIIIWLPGINLLLMLLGNFGTPVAKLHYIHKFFANFSLFRFMMEAEVLLQYGFDRCRPKQLQSVLFKMMIEHDEYLYYCLFMLVFLSIFFRVMACLVLLAKTNPFENRRQRAQKISHYHHNFLKNYIPNVIVPGMGCHHDSFEVKRIGIC